MIIIILHNLWAVQSKIGAIGLRRPHGGDQANGDGGQAHVDVHHRELKNVQLACENRKFYLWKDEKGHQKFWQMKYTKIWPKSEKAHVDEGGQNPIFVWTS